nr:hypothetical protein [Biomaibacter acetigenes]
MRERITMRFIIFLPRILYLVTKYAMGMPRRAAKIVEKKEI